MCILCMTSQCKNSQRDINASGQWMGRKKKKKREKITLAFLCIRAVRLMCINGKKKSKEKTEKKKEKRKIHQNYPCSRDDAGLSLYGRDHRKSASVRKSASYSTTAIPLRPNGKCRKQKIEKKRRGRKRKESHFPIGIRRNKSVQNATLFFCRNNNIRRTERMTCVYVNFCVSES